MNTGITVSFSHLTKDQAEELIELYASFSGVGSTTVEGQRHTADPLPNPRPQAPAAPRAPVAPKALQNGAAGGEITHDKFGVPFHPDYHSSVRRLNDDGSWKARRGVDKAAYKAFNAANRGGEGTGGAPTAAQLNQQFAAPPVPSAPTMPPVTVDQWVAKCTELYGAQKWTTDFVTNMNAACGVADQGAYMIPENAAARSMSYGIMAAA
mgnify:FL=1